MPALVHDDDGAIWSETGPEHSLIPVPGAVPDRLDRTYLGRWVPELTPAELEVSSAVILSNPATLENLRDVSGEELLP